MTLRPNPIESTPWPDPLARVLDPIFEALPLGRSMPQLRPNGPAGSDVVLLVDQALETPELRSALHLQAALWLYVDELESSHRVSQALSDAAGAYWHGIMHRREGDFGNAKYWFHRANALPIRPDSDPIAFVDLAERDHGDNAPALILRQRQEWQSFFAWCAENSTSLRSA